MAQHVIVQKLNREFQQPIRSERQVVYILAEIRKLLELTKTENKFGVLNFYCNWALHPEMDRPAAQKVVKLFDSHEGLDTEKRKQVKDRIGKDFTETIKLDKLRKEIGKFCREHKIVETISSNFQEWTHFMRHYARVIEDCPLVGEAPHLKRVKRVVVRVRADGKKKGGPVLSLG